jgi:hypothetical protein
MKNPITIGTKTIDAANVVAIKPMTQERLSGINTDKNFTAEIRALGSPGAFVEKHSVAEIVAAFKQHGEDLTLLPTGEAIRTGERWMLAITAFSERPGGKFGSSVQMKNPHNGATGEERFAARPEQIPGGDAPTLDSLVAQGPVKGVA